MSADAASDVLIVEVDGMRLGLHGAAVVHVAPGRTRDERELFVTSSAGTTRIRVDRIVGLVRLERDEIAAVPGSVHAFGAPAWLESHFEHEGAVVWLVGGDAPCWPRIAEEPAP